MTVLERQRLPAALGAERRPRSEGQVVAESGGPRAPEAAGRPGAEAARDAAHAVRSAAVAEKGELAAGTPELLADGIGPDERGAHQPPADRAGEPAIEREAPAGPAVGLEEPPDLERRTGLRGGAAGGHSGRGEQGEAPHGDPRTAHGITRRGCAVRRSMS